MSFTPRTLEDIGRQVDRILDAMRSQRLSCGNGTPLGNVLGKVGDLYVNLDGGATTTLWVKESGDKTSDGWVAK